MSSLQGKLPIYLTLVHQRILFTITAFNKMNPTDKNITPLRRLAEAELSRAQKQEPKSKLSSDALLYELQVQQIELEMQNEELQRSHAELESANKRYADLYEFSPAGYLTVSRKGLISEVNISGAELLGEPRKKLLGRIFSRYISPEDSDHWYLHFMHALKTGEALHCELKIQRADNSIVHVLLESKYKEIDEKTALLITLTDITERKVTEIEWKNSQAQLRALVRTIPDLIWLKDVEGVYLSCNPNFERFYGAKEAEILGKTDYDFTDKAQADFFRANDRKAMHANHGCINEEWLTFADDGYHGLFETIKIAVHADDDDGSIIGVLGLAHDITERKNTENSLRIAATAFDSQEGMTVTDANGLILRVNKAFTKITGYTQEDVVGQNPRLFKSGRHDIDFYKNLWKSIKSKGLWEGEIWNSRKSGEIYPAHLTITSVKDEAGIISNYVATLSDITASKAASEKINNLAFYDPLTQLANRRLLLDRLVQTLTASARFSRRGALLFLDLDHFKTLNDTLGHDVGDLLLQQVATRITTCVREGDTVARLGGDEFVVLLENLSEQEIEAATQTKLVAEKILLTLNQPYQLDTYTHHSTPSIGVTLFSGHEFRADDLMKQADIAMYQSKTEGRNTIRFFDPKMQEAITTRASLENELRKAIEQNQFQLHYQVQVDRAGKAIGAEALIRWLHPERGMISPLDFIPLAEDTGLIFLIGQWVLEAACAQLQSWQKSSTTKDLMLSVNVSVKQFHQAGFVEQVKATLQRYEIIPARLKLELSERILVDNVDDVIIKMDALSKIGVRFSLDDFGTGYSSLHHLKKFPLNQLKIDRSFMRDILTDDSDRAFAKTIIAMAHSLGIKVIAEGVETAEQQQFLLDNGCLIYQGCLFGKPVPIDEFEALYSASII